MRACMSDPERLIKTLDSIVRSEPFKVSVAESSLVVFAQLSPVAEEKINSKEMSHQPLSISRRHAAKNGNSEQQYSESNDTLGGNNSQRRRRRKLSPKLFPPSPFSLFFPLPLYLIPLSLSVSLVMSHLLSFTRGAACQGRLEAAEPAPRQPSYSINIVTAEEPPVLTSPARAETIEKEETSLGLTPRVTSRNPFQDETKPHLTKQS